MTRARRVMLSLAALALGLLYVQPLWRISLDAPQYPEGLGLYIWIDTVTGVGQHDLTNINNLNHYIGMKRIEPDAIPELRFMPWIVAGLIALGLLAALSGKPGLLYAWTLLFVILAVAGLIDFYLWEYDYGHNLDVEHAIIKVPGMSYQPPLLGSKQLLNFTATSWPSWGGIVAAFSLLGGLWLSTSSLLRNRRRRRVAALSAA